MKSLSAINEKTYVSIGLVVMIVGGVSWLSFVAYESKASVKAIKEIRDEFKDFKEREVVQSDQILKYMMSIDQRLSRLEGRLGVK